MGSYSPEPEAMMESETPLPENSKSLTKTLTFGLGPPRAYDKNSDSFSDLSKEQRDRVYREIDKGFYDFARLCNFTTSLFYASRVLNVDVKGLGYNTGYRPILEKQRLDTHLNGKVLNQAYGLAKAHFTGEHEKSLMRRGDSVLPTHKWNGTHPIQFHRDAVRLRVSNGDILIAFNLLEDRWSREEGLPAWVAFPVIVKKRDLTLKAQLTKTISGEWEQKSGRILRSTRLRGRKLRGQISVGFQVSPQISLSDRVVMGIDLGVASPAALHIRRDNVPEKWAMLIGNGRQMFYARDVIKKEITRLVRALRTKNSPLTGPAREMSLRRLQGLRKRERRIMKTASQRLAAQIAQVGKENGAGIWQLEDLNLGGKTDVKLSSSGSLEAPDEGSVKDKSSWLRRHWAPGMLVDALRWQALQLGVELKLVNPRYTSQLCSNPDCGHISRENRPKGKKGQAFFKCVACGHEEHADKNAARNLSVRDIDQLISKRLGG